MKKYGGNKEITESKSTKNVRAKIRYALRWLAPLDSKPAPQISILSMRWTQDLTLTHNSHPIYALDTGPNTNTQLTFHF